MPTPSRASVAADGGSTPQPRGGRGRGGRPPRPADVDDESYRLMLAGAAIDWRSKLQPTVALSTVEAEAMALCAATVEVEYTRGLLSELSGDKYIPEATPVYVDNKGARDDAYNKTGKRTRHINLRFHRVREAVAKNSIDVKRVTGGNDPATSEMVADILTKSTPAPLFVVMASTMSGMHRK